MTTVTRGIDKRMEILEFIRDFIKVNDFSPTLTEIADGVGLKSPSNVRSHLLLLQHDGMITCQNGKFRTIRLTGKKAK